MKKAKRFLAVSCGIAILSGALAWGDDPKVKSKKEAEAFQAMQQSLQSAKGPDDQLAAIEGFLTKFADTQFKVLLLQNAMQVAQGKDPALAVTYAERVIEVDPKNFEAYVTIASVTATNAKEFDLDKADKTTKVAKYAQLALDNVKDYPKPFSQMPDDQWAAQKKGAAAQAHAAIAMMDMVNKKYDDGIKEFQTAMETAPDSITQFRLGEAYMKAGKLDEADSTFDKVLAAPDAPAQVKQYARQRKADVAKLKAAKAK
jgi:tetratricopeptide (TPR) repeat protein